ncbi:MAG: FG-GAP repeat protein [Euryarchaeota archaeon]|nr:FG-GAP repeat protein [Euryarchaeota archaeon]
MTNTILGILVCMLMLATAVPAVTSVKNNAINATVPNTPQTCMIGNWLETQKLLPSDGRTNAQFGGIVDIDGDTALIGANQDFGTAGWWSGAAYVFVRNGTTWTQQAKLTASDAATSDYFGWSVSLSGDTALITAIWDDNENGQEAGSAYVFTRAGTTWTQQQKLLASDGAAKDHLGYVCALDGDTAFIGANWDDDNGDGSGSVFVFTRNGTTWTQQAKLLASDGQTGDRFGGSIALSGDTAIIGAYYDDDNGNDSGSAYVFTRTGTTWTQQQKLLPSDGAAGDTFGATVSLSGDTAFIAAEYDDDNGNDSGSVYVFTRSGTTWTQQQKLLPSDGEAGDNFGGSVSLSDGTVLIGAWFDDDNGVHSGSVYEFTKTGLTFSIAGGIGVKAVIKNNGTTAVNDIPWQLHVEGGILKMINKTVNGTIDIPAGKSVTLKTGMLLGFGAISIIAKVANEEQTATGTQLIILSIVPK